MLDRIETLRQKSEHHRRRVALGTSLGITAVIFGIWAVTFPTRFPELVPSTQAQTATVLNSQDPSNVASPLQALRESLANGYQNFAQTIGSTTLPSGSSVVSNGVVITDPQADTSNDLQIVK